MPRCFPGRVLPLKNCVNTEPGICGYRLKKQLVFQREVNYLGDWDCFLGLSLVADRYRYSFDMLSAARACSYSHMGAS